MSELASPKLPQPVELMARLLSLTSDMAATGDHLLHLLSILNLSLQDYLQRPFSILCFVLQGKPLLEQQLLIEMFMLPATLNVKTLDYKLYCLSVLHLS